MRINAYLAKAGFGSRRKVEGLVREGRIHVNGKSVDLLATQVYTEDTVTVDGRVIYPQSPVYYALNKPVGVICSTAKQTDDPIVLDFLPHHSHLFIVGRLDKDSQGLVILTNDGDFTQSVNHPAAKIIKTYQVTVSGTITSAKIHQMKNGLMVGGQKLAVDEVINTGKNHLVITLHEGKHRHIRRLCAALDLHVSKLVRTSIGKLQLDTLKPGIYRQISPTDVL